MGPPSLREPTPAVATRSAARRASRSPCYAGAAMRLGVAVLATLTVCAVRLAAAQPAPPVVGDPDAMVAEGETLARTGEYTRAIDLFKRADGIAKRTRHACLIGLVYTRRELWSQAE